MTAETSTMAASEAARLGAEAAGRSAAAVARAAENAQKPGSKTSELKVTIASFAFAGLVGGLNAIAVVPGPWQLFAVLGLGVIAGGAAYSNSRAKVKAAALGEAGALAATSVSSGPLFPPSA